MEKGVALVEMLELVQGLRLSCEIYRGPWIASSFGRRHPHQEGGELRVQGRSSDSASTKAIIRAVTSRRLEVHILGGCICLLLIQRIFKIDTQPLPNAFPHCLDVGIASAENTPDPKNYSRPNSECLHSLLHVTALTNHTKYRHLIIFPLSVLTGISLLLTMLMDLFLLNDPKSGPLWPTYYHLDKG